MRPNSILLMLFFALAITTVSCLDEGVTFTYSMFVTDDSGQCTTLDDFACTPCTHDNTTFYYRCVAQVPGSSYSECIIYRDSACQRAWDDYSTDDLSSCGKAYPCEPAIQADTVLRMTAAAPDPITVIIDYSVFSEVELSTSQVRATVMAESMSLRSLTTTLDFEKFQANGTFLTSAGQCAYGEKCQAGDISYIGEQVPFPSAYQLPSLQLSLFSKPAVVQSRSEDLIFFSAIVDAITADLETVGELIFFDPDDFGVAVSDIYFDGLDTDAPIMNYIGYTNGESVGYQTARCRASFAGPLENISCELSDIFDELEGQ